VALADFIRNNDQSLQDASKKVLAVFQEEMLPCETFAEFCDVAGTASLFRFRRGLASGDTDDTTSLHLKDPVWLQQSVLVSDSSVTHLGRLKMQDWYNG